MLNPDDRLSVIKIIHADPHISEADKNRLVNKIEGTSNINDSFWNGIAGAGAALAVSHFLKLSRNAQILLTIAGYGIGKYLLDNTDKRAKLMEYNDKSKSYNLNV